MVPQPRRQALLIDIAFTDFFKGNHLLSIRSVDIGVRDVVDKRD